MIVHSLQVHSRRENPGEDVPIPAVVQFALVEVYLLATEPRPQFGYERREGGMLERDLPSMPVVRLRDKHRKRRLSLGVVATVAEEHVRRLPPVLGLVQGQQPVQPLHRRPDIDLH